MNKVPTVECEVRSFIDAAKFAELYDFFVANASYVGEEEQETRYFDCPQDLRIQKGRSHAKVWLKKGEMHAEGREEIELRVPREEFATLERLFDALGYGVKIVWYRRRLTFLWDGIGVSLDDTRGYGRIIELEIMTTPEDQEMTVALLKEKLTELGVSLTPKEEFAARFAHYEKHWRELTAKENEKTPA